ncbi:MAG: hypothetical protein EOO10_01490 [Chitinophagaceae bacterium]|nr:MAG: hypothetical protein EOO10_01490 [Chitinophagaceae bacterium]
MTATNLYTRKLLGLDYRVWLSMLVMCFACLALVGYMQVKSSSVNAVPCAKEITITINGIEVKDNAVSYLDQLALFHVITEKGAQVEWDFGDGSDIVSGLRARHTFHEESVFPVQVTVNGHCTYVLDVTVRSEPTETIVEPEIIIIPDSTKVTMGGQLRFSCASNLREESYEWRLLGTSEVQTTQTAVFTFENVGVQTVELMLNKDPNKTKRIQIEVSPIVMPINNNPLGVGGSGNPAVPTDLLQPGENPFAQNGQAPGRPNPSQREGLPPVAAPETQKPDSTEAIAIDPETFQTLMQAVLNGEKEVADLYPYLHYTESTLVQRRGDDEAVRLTIFCRQNMNRRIQSLEFIRDDRNAVQRIRVAMRRRGPFGIFGG